MLSLANVRSEEELRAWVARMRNHLAREGIADPQFQFVCRAEDRRAGDQPALPRRALRARGDARQRRDRRGRDAQPAHDRARSRCASTTRRRWSRCAARCTCRCRTSRRSTSAGPQAGQSTFMNPRNSAAGTIRQLDPALTRPSGRCRSGATRSACVEGLSFDDHWQALEWLREHGFRVNRDISVLDERGRGDRAVPGVAAAPRASSTSRSTASSSRSTTSSCSVGSGSVGRDPRWAVAWKFPPTTAMTRLVKVHVERGQVRRPAPVRGARAGARSAA